VECLDTKLSGWVLAGGHSRRMGRPKWSLNLDGQRMLDRQVRLLASVCHRVAVVGPATGFGPDTALAPLECPLVFDVVPDCGPLGGIFTALLHTRTEFNLVLSCDLPFVEARFLRYLAVRAISSEADVTVPDTPGHGYQPLVAAYRRRARWAIERSLGRGRHKTTSFYRRVRVEVIRWPEIVKQGFTSRLFANMNTPEDYEEALRRL
jgi:molybdopterin-guanine dinucleotide biosynthesis protein A